MSGIRAGERSPQRELELPEAKTTGSRPLAPTLRELSNQVAVDVLVSPENAHASGSRSSTNESTQRSLSGAFLPRTQSSVSVNHLNYGVSRLSMKEKKAAIKAQQTPEQLTAAEVSRKNNSLAKVHSDGEKAAIKESKNQVNMVP
jgi:hypothetical protein